MTINGGRLWRRLLELGSVGARDDGVYCLAYSPEEDRAHEMAAAFMEEAGLAVRRDAAGNLIGRRKGDDPALPVVVTGSHLDSVYGGGIFDGRLGVAAGIEALQAMGENGVKTRYPVEVCAYRAEEGTRFKGDISGARHMTGSGAEADLAQADRDGMTLGEALAARGIDPVLARSASMPRGYAKAHVELHIEQGPVLEEREVPVGIVSAVSCQTRAECIVRGRAAHAGATPFPLRRDALCAAAEIVLAVEEEGSGRDGCTATVGELRVFPGGVNVVPGCVRFSVDVRHVDPAIKNRVFEKIVGRAEGICRLRRAGWELRAGVSQNEPLPCHPDIISLLSSVCERLRYPVVTLPSGAGHDSTSFMRICPTGMIFVRSRNGISHNKDEYSSPADCL
ncbi:MAG: Zn-dependent hydrolase, partial [Planctomycetota bacterium]|nr:Zn-dependent hydrolase [Planctomycetota bacterium]